MIVLYSLQVNIVLLVPFVSTVADGTLEPCHLPTTELREREAQTSLAAGVTIITVVVVVIVGLLVASFVIGATCVCVRKRRSLQNMIV